MATLATSLLIQTQAVAAPRPTVDQVRQQVATLNARAEVATEKYNATREKLTSLNVRSAAAQVRLGRQRRAVDLARSALGQIAADTYKAGDLATLSLFLGDNPDQYVSTNGLLVSLGDRKARAVTDLLHQRQQLLAGMTDVQEQQQRLQEAGKELQDAQNDVQHQLAEATALLGRLTADQRNQLNKGLSASYRTGLAGLGVTVPTTGNPACKDVPQGALDARVAKVIAFACTQLGDPYQWGGSGPTRFDCSGLTMTAWKQAGVSLPHNAALQATYGSTVPLADLRPGDLVFFFHPISHNGIYLGGGLMIHAPKTGDVVKIAPLLTGDFSTAVRL